MGAPRHALRARQGDRGDGRANVRGTRHQPHSADRTHPGAETEVAVDVAIRASPSGDVQPNVTSKRGSSTACPGASRKSRNTGHSAQNDVNSGKYSIMGAAAAL